MNQPFKKYKKSMDFALLTTKNSSPSHSRYSSALTLRKTKDARSQLLRSQVKDKSLMRGAISLFCKKQQLQRKFQMNINLKRQKQLSLEQRKLVLENKIYSRRSEYYYVCARIQRTLSHPARLPLQSLSAYLHAFLQAQKFKRLKDVLKTIKSISTLNRITKILRKSSKRSKNSNAKVLRLERVEQTIISYIIIQQRRYLCVDFLKPYKSVRVSLGTEQEQRLQGGQRLVYQLLIYTEKQEVILFSDLLKQKKQKLQKTARRLIMSTRLRRLARLARYDFSIFTTPLTLLYDSSQDFMYKGPVCHRQLRGYVSVVRGSSSRVEFYCKGFFASQKWQMKQEQIKKEVLQEQIQVHLFERRLSLRRFYSKESEQLILIKKYVKVFFSKKALNSLRADTQIIFNQASLELNPNLILSLIIIRRKNQPYFLLHFTSTRLDSLRTLQHFTFRLCDNHFTRSVAKLPLLKYLSRTNGEFMQLNMRSVQADYKSPQEGFRNRQLIKYQNLLEYHLKKFLKRFRCAREFSKFNLICKIVSFNSNKYLLTLLRHPHNQNAFRLFLQSLAVHHKFNHFVDIDRNTKQLFEQSKRPLEFLVVEKDFIRLNEEATVSAICKKKKQGRVRVNGSGHKQHTQKLIFQQRFKNFTVVLSQSKYLDSEQPFQRRKFKLLLFQGDGQQRQLLSQKPLCLKLGFQLKDRVSKLVGVQQESLLIKVEKTGQSSAVYL